MFEASYVTKSAEKVEAGLLFEILLEALRTGKNLRFTLPQICELTMHLDKRSAETEQGK